MEIVLVGGPGSGTRTVGRALAERRHARFVDLTGDPSRWLDALAGVRPAAEPGPDPAVRRVIAADLIVADTAVRSRLFLGRRVVWLDVPSDRLVERLRAARRGDFDVQGDYRRFIEQHMTVYRPFYAPGDRVDASGSIDATISGIEAALADPVGPGNLILRADVHRGQVELGQGILERSLLHVLGRLSATHCSVLSSAKGTRRAEATARWLVDAGVRADVVELPAGEEAKRLRYQEVLFRSLAARRHERQDPLVAIGDEDLLEGATFASAVWLRGVPLVAVPTTTLGCIDTAIGGKGGIDLPGAGRNLLGAFHEATATILDIDLLDGEAAADRRAALAEAVKYGLLGEAGLMSLLEASPGADAGAWPTGTQLLELVERSALAKRRLVLDDERDIGGVRIALNLGHTLSHALESATGYRMRHGDAVAYGLRCALAIGAAVDITPAPVAARAHRVLQRLGLGQARLDLEPDEVLRYVGADKKRRGGRQRWVLVGADGIVVRDDIPPSVVEESVRTTIAGVNEVTTAPP